MYLDRMMNVSYVYVYMYESICRWCGDLSVSAINGMFSLRKYKRGVRMVIQNMNFRRCLKSYVPLW
jgi:hypothetical protein